MSDSPSPKKRKIPFEALLIAAMLGLVAVSEGRNVAHDLREAARVKTDPHTRGRVLEVRDTGRWMGDDPLMEVSVEFTTASGEVVRAKTIERIVNDDLKILLGNPEIDVWYDAKNPSDVVLRWRPR